MTGEPDDSALCPARCASSSASTTPPRAKCLAGSLSKTTLVDLPQVEIVGAQAPQRVFELAHRDSGVAAVRADLRHQEHTVTAVRDRLGPCAVSLETIVVVPGVVHERDAGIDRSMGEPHRGAVGIRHPEVPAAEAEARDAFTRSAERPGGDIDSVASHEKPSRRLYPIRTVSSRAAPARAMKSAIFRSRTPSVSRLRRSFSEHQPSPVRIHVDYVSCRAWTVASAGIGQAPAAQPPVTKFEEIRRGVGYFTGSGGTIGYLVNSSGAIAIDSQFMLTGEICAAGLKQRSPKGVELLINTHHHGDHTGGNGASGRSPRRSSRTRTA